MEATLEQSFFGPAANQRELTPYQKRLANARQALVDRGYNFRSPVYITAYDTSDDEINTEESRRRIGMTFEVTGQYAAIRLAERTHRLAHPEEIRNFLEARKKREEDLARIENDRPENKLRGAMEKALTAAVDAGRSAAPAAQPAISTTHTPESSPARGNNNRAPKD